MQFDKQLLLCLAIFVAFSFASFFLPFFSSDEYGYMSSGREIIEGKFTEIGDVNRFPLFPFALSAVYSIFGYSEFATKLFLALLGFATIILFHTVAKSALGQEAAFISTLIFTSNPLFLYLSTRVLTEPLFFFLLVAFFACLLKAPSNNIYAILLGVATGALFATRYIGLLAVPIVILYFGYLWYYHKPQNWSWLGLILGIIFFLLSLPVFSQIIYSSPFELVSNFLSFFSQQTSGLNEAAVFSLPDKLPLYLIALPFLLVFATPFLWKGVQEFWKTKEKNKALILAAIVSIVFYAGLEVYGFFNVALLRYVAPFVPFLALFAANVQLPFKLGDFVVDKKMLYAVVVLNLLLATSVFAFFASYPKYVGYSEAGQWVAENCQSSNSNIQKVLKHYSDRDNDLNGECTVVSSYDGELLPRTDQQVAFESHGVAVYK